MLIFRQAERVSKIELEEGEKSNQQFSSITCEVNFNKKLAHQKSQISHLTSV